MKRLILSATILFTTISCFSQADSSVKKDSVKPAAAPVDSSAYALVLTPAEFAELLQVIDIADLRPSDRDKYKNYLMSRTQVLKTQRAEPPKKEKPKK